MLRKRWELRGRDSPKQASKMLAEYWFGIFRDPVTGRRRSTGLRMTVVEAQEYPLAQQVPGTLQLRNPETDFEDTVPLVFHTESNQ